MIVRSLAAETIYLGEDKWKARTVEIIEEVTDTFRPAAIELQVAKVAASRVGREIRYASQAVDQAKHSLRRLERVAAGKAA